MAKFLFLLLAFFSVQTQAQTLSLDCSNFILSEMPKYQKANYPLVFMIESVTPDFFNLAVEVHGYFSEDGKNYQYKEISTVYLKYPSCEIQAVQFLSSDSVR